MKITCITNLCWIIKMNNKYFFNINKMDSIDRLKTALEDVQSDNSIVINIDNHIETNTNNNISTIETNENENKIKRLLDVSLPYIKVIVIIIVNTIISFIINIKSKKLH